MPSARAESLRELIQALSLRLADRCRITGEQLRAPVLRGLALRAKGGAIADLHPLRILEQPPQERSRRRDGPFAHLPPPCRAIDRGLARDQATEDARPGQRDPRPRQCRHVPQLPKPGIAGGPAIEQLVEHWLYPCQRAITISHVIPRFSQRDDVRPIRHAAGRTARNHDRESRAVDDEMRAFA